MFVSSFFDPIVSSQLSESIILKSWSLRHSFQISPVATRCIFSDKNLDWFASLEWRATVLFTCYIFIFNIIVILPGTVITICKLSCHFKIVSTTRNDGNCGTTTQSFTARTWWNCCCPISSIVTWGFMINTIPEFTEMCTTHQYQPCHIKHKGPPPNVSGHVRRKDTKQNNKWIYEENALFDAHPIVTSRRRHQWNLTWI